MKSQLIIWSVLLLLASSVFAQEKEIHKDVVIVKPYQPVIDDAQKINDLPAVKDSMQIKPAIEYFIIPYELGTTYSPRPVKPAKLLGVPETKLYNSFMRAGIGNYTKPMGEIYVSNTLESDYAYTFNGFHESSFSKLKLDNGARVPAGYHDSYLDMSAIRMYKKMEWEGSVEMTDNGLYHYGYNTLNPALSGFVPERKEIKQNLFLFHANTSVSSTHLTDSSKDGFSAEADYRLFDDYFGNSEHKISAKGNYARYFRSNKIGLAGGYSIFNHNNDSLTRVLANIRPYISRNGEIWSAYAGLDLYNNKTLRYTTPHYYPVGHLECNIMKHYVVPYAGVTGGIEINNYSELVFQNPFLLPGFEPNLLKHHDYTDHQMNIYGGVKGSFSPSLAFNFLYSYDVIDNMYFFVNDSSTYLGNYFTVAFYDVEYRKYTGELLFKRSQNFSFFLRVNRNLYRFNNANLIADANLKPWHKPLWDASFTATYNIQNKIIATAGIYVLGERYAKSYLPGAQPIRLNEFTDINLGIEYKYSTVLSAFLKLNNITSAVYEKWHQYPTQRFNMMLGISYSF